MVFAGLNVCKTDREMPAVDREMQDADRCAREREREMQDSKREKEAQDVDRRYYMQDAEIDGSRMQRDKKKERKTQTAPEFREREDAAERHGF